MESESRDGQDSRLLEGSNPYDSSPHFGSMHSSSEVFFSCAFRFHFARLRARSTDLFNCMKLCVPELGMKSANAEDDIESGLLQVKASRVRSSPSPKMGSFPL